FAHRLADVLGGHVVLEIDEGAALVVGPRAGGSTQHAAGPGFAGNAPPPAGVRCRQSRRRGGVIGADPTPGLRPAPPPGGKGKAPSLFTSRNRFRDGRPKRVGAVAGADRDAILRILAGQETLRGLVE